MTTNEEKEVLKGRISLNLGNNTYLHLPSSSRAGHALLPYVTLGRFLGLARVAKLKATKNERVIERLCEIADEYEREK
jgi:hypothetical protein